jgi:hypothetical protein
MRIIIIIIIIFSFTFSSCYCQQLTNAHQKEKIDTLTNISYQIITECIPHDTTTASGLKIHYLNNNGSYQITWGSESFMRTYDSLYSCEKDDWGNIWDEIPRLEAETPNYIVFKNVLTHSGGGNPEPIEFYAIVLPKNPVDTNYEKEFYIKTIGNYMIYSEPFSFETLVILNLETKKNQKIILEPSAFEGYRTLAWCIKKMQIEQGKFYIDYKALNKNHDSYIEKKEFDLNL